MSSEAKRTATAWPEWMLRFIATDDEQAFSDLIWSVGGSPPYGGVSYEEGAAVYDFLDGPDKASATKYQKLKSFIQNQPDRLTTLELYYIDQQIISAPDNFSSQLVSKGKALAEKLNHDGVRGLFFAYESQLAHQRGDIAGAREKTMQALTIFLRLADQDQAYALRAAQTAQNAISFTALSGDMDTARQLQTQLQPVLDGFDFN